MRTRGIAFVVLALILCITTGGAQTPPPIVILVSFDGWRSDYTDRADVPNLKALAARGVKADGLVPAFPPKTFPNHYTLVTGLYPEHHGIVANVMREPGFPALFTMSSATAKDSRWWGGEPLWVTARRQGRLTASMFWPGSEVRIGGLQPDYWRPFDDRLPNALRVKQVIDWLALPEAERPQFVTLYFSEVDSAGHAHGPDSPQVMDAAAHLDAELGDLIAGVSKLGLSERTTVVVVSDHGMSQLSDERVIFLDDYIDLKTVTVVEMSPNLGLIPHAGPAAAVRDALKDRHPALTVYTREEMPERLHYRASERIPPVLGLADDGWTITTRAAFATRLAAGRPAGGAHGYDPMYQPMRGLFVAAGPGLRRGLAVPAFESVHVYGLLCELLGLTPAPNDGDPAVTRGLLER